MSLIVRVNGWKAILCGTEWRCAHRVTEAALNDATETWISLSGGHPASARDPEKAVAEEMARRFEGRILLHLESDALSLHRKLDQLRQMALPYSRHFVVR